MGRVPQRPPRLTAALAVCFPSGSSRGRVRDGIQRLAPWGAAHGRGRRAGGCCFGQGDDEVAELALEGLSTLRGVTFGLLSAPGSVYSPGEVDALFPEGQPGAIPGRAVASRGRSPGPARARGRRPLHLPPPAWLSTPRESQMRGRQLGSSSLTLSSSSPSHSFLPLLKTHPHLLATHVRPHRTGCHSPLEELGWSLPGSLKPSRDS